MQAFVGAAGGEGGFLDAVVGVEPGSCAPLVWRWFRRGGVGMVGGVGVPSQATMILLPARLVAAGVGLGCRDWLMLTTQKKGGQECRRCAWRGWR